MPSNVFVRSQFLFVLLQSLSALSIFVLCFYHTDYLPHQLEHPPALVWGAYDNLTSSIASDSVGNLHSYTPKFYDTAAEHHGWTTRYDFNDQDKQNCSLTVVIMDPRFAYFPANDTIYIRTLESVADYVPRDACIVLQISLCLMHHCQQRNYTKDIWCIDDETIPRKEKPKNYSCYDERVLSECRHQEQSPRISASKIPSLLSQAALQMYQRSGPLLKSQFWERGRLRVSLLETSRYNIRPCEQFKPNMILQKSEYWMNEFIHPQDADRVLVMQRDAFLCKPMPLNLWKDLAYVGGPWPSDFFWMRRFYNSQVVQIPPERVSTEEPSLTAWKDYWNRVEKQYTGHILVDKSAEKNVPCDTIEEQVNHIQCPLPPFPANLTFPKKLPDPNFWVGNGGLSLRSRKWMVRMIRLCESKNKICSAGGMQEDMYFSLFLTLTGAPIATAEQAALFAMDMDAAWPNQIFEYSNSTINDIMDSLVAEEYQREMQQMGHAMPFGQHKCFLSFVEGDNACIEPQWCKYSFNTDGRPSKVADLSVERKNYP